jgi:DNA gyrase subunit B
MLAGDELVQQVEQDRMARTLLQTLSSKVGRMALCEQAAIAGAFKINLASADADAAAQYVAKRMDLLSPENEKGWKGVAKNGAYEFNHLVGGVTSTYKIDPQLIQSAEARKLDEMAPKLQKRYVKPAQLLIGDEEKTITGPVSLVEAILERGKKGQAVQRYKGLGEMNPDQLWKTTLDPNHRSLLQVKIAHVDEAESVFSTLMGDLVEPRRDFIQANALKVTNLDV